MARIDFAVLVAAAALLTPTAALSQSPDDAVLRSMQDELARSRKLAIPGLEKPYFIQYSLDDARTFSTSASLGASLGVTDHQFRIPQVRVRVGDPSFDNTNYIFSDLTGGSRFDPEQFPVDDNYAVLRRDWWLATDRAYKGAVEAIARKRAALKNITQPEVIPDLWAAKPMQKLASPDKKSPTGAAGRNAYALFQRLSLPIRRLFHRGFVSTIRDQLTISSTPKERRCAAPSPWLIFRFSVSVHAGRNDSPRCFVCASNRTILNAPA